MAKIKEYGYVQFPLCLLMETYSDTTEGFNVIVRFGIVNFAKTFKYNINEVGRQLMYCYYRDQDLMPKRLLDTMKKYIKNDKLSTDEDYNGFNGSEFDPLEYTTELMDLFESDQVFKNDAVLHYQIRQACKTDFLGVQIGSMTSLLKGYEAGCKRKSDFEAQFGPDAMASVKVKQLFQFRDSGKDLDLFRAFLAIKSLLGMKAYVKGNKPIVLSRMVGCKSIEAFEYYITNKKVTNPRMLETVEKYSKRYHMDKLLLELREKKFIMCVSKGQCRDLYFSSYMEPDELVKRVHATKENSMEVKLKNAAKLL